MRSRRSGRCSTAISRTRSTTCPRSASRRRPARGASRERRRRGEGAAEGRRDRLGVSVGPPLPVPGGHLPGRGNRPAGGHPGRGHQLARGRRAARGGGHPRGLRPLLELLHQDLLPDTRGTRERARPQGTDRAPRGRKLVRHPAQGAPLQVPPARARPVGGGLTDRWRELAAPRAGGLGASRALMPELPDSTTHLVVGAGVHGLSTAWHLAERGEQVLVVDRSGVAAGASGIACGVVRNNYFQPAMSELMAACAEIWESDPETLHYHGSGYIALGPPGQQADLVEVYERQQRIGYPSELILGEAEVTEHMRGLFEDWRGIGLSVCLHEHAGGFAFNRESMLGLADKARAAGAGIVEGVEVSRFEFDGSGAVERVITNAGPIEVEQVVVAVGPWIGGLWSALGL